MQSEYGGRDSCSGLAINPLRPHGRLTPSDRLMLGYRTGTEDPNEAPNKAIWHGFDPKEKVTIPKSRIPKG